MIEVLMLIAAFGLLAIVAVEGWRRAFLARKSGLVQSDPRRREQDLLNRMYDLVEQRTRMLDALAQPACYVDRNGRYQFANAAYCRRMNRTLAELLQAGIGDVLSEAELDAVRPRLLAVFRGETSVARSGAPAAGDQAGAIRYIPMLRPGGSQVEGYVEIHEQADADEPSAAAEPDVHEPLRRLVAEAQSLAMLLLDPSGQILTWNRGAAEITGWSEGEVCGQHVSRLYPFESIVRGDPERMLQQVRDNGRHEEFGWRLRKDGGGFWCRVTVTAIASPAGGISAFGMTFQDMSAQTELQQVAGDAV